MAKESFEDLEVAEYLNTHFVPIKVDREERPDIDKQFMFYIQATTGSGGWPSTLLLTPSLKPFFGGTYFPARDIGERTGLITILQHFAAEWKEKGEEIETSAGKTVEVLKRLQEKTIDRTSTKALDSSLLVEAAKSIEKGYDEVHGGFGNAPKFPEPAVYKFLLDFSVIQTSGCNWLLKNLDKMNVSQLSTIAFENGIPVASTVSLISLQAQVREHTNGKVESGKKLQRIVVDSWKKICCSGIYDHIDGGIHRYAVDQAFQLPHFEKMLYDQAQVIGLLAEAFIIAKDQFLLEKAQEMMRFCEVKMQSKEYPLFCSAIDADSPLEGGAEKAEGAYYCWSFEELQNVVSKEDFEAFSRDFCLEPKGNLPDKGVMDAHLRGKCILRAQSPHVLLKHRDSLQRLGEYREKHRKMPSIDEKCAVSGNSMMICAFVRLFYATNSSKYLHSAIRMAEFIFRNMYYEETGILEKIAGTSIEAFSEDYTNLIRASLDLYQATLDSQWIEWAFQLQRTLETNFCDENGIVFVSKLTSPDTIIPTRDDFDGAELSANSLNVCNMLTLSFILSSSQFEEKASQVLHAYSKEMKESPAAVSGLLSALKTYLHSPIAIQIVGELGGSEALNVIRECWNFSNFILVGCDSDEKDGFLCKSNPLIREMFEQIPATDKVRVQICKNFKCILAESGENGQNIRSIFEQFS